MSRDSDAAVAFLESYLNQEGNQPQNTQNTRQHRTLPLYTYSISTINALGSHHIPSKKLRDKKTRSILLSSALTRASTSPRSRHLITMSTIILDGPTTAALNAAIQPKLAEVGWSTGGADDSALAEYIILMLANGKTQDQIAAELSGDLLNLGPDDPGAREFAQWLFEQVAYLTQQQQNGGAVQQNGQAAGSMDGGHDEVMGDASEAGESNVYVQDLNDLHSATNL
jgi:hypothetical protein